MTTSASLALRALLAVVLMVGFYLLALAIAGLLVWLPVLEYSGRHGVHVKLALVCFVAAGVIVWSVLPRWDRFVEPGVRLTPDAQPEFFAVLRKIAEGTGQRMPEEAYLVGDVNAFVTQRGGIMGFFSRRVLGIGLPLLRAMSVDQVRAVLAHEFGHFHGGDTRLGPWIYKTRAAIGRTVTSLMQVNSVISYPFRWYGLLYLRITQAISRAQEFSADRLAATFVGRTPLTTGLEMAPVLGALFEHYWSQEFVPVLEAGRRPPLADGFRRFLAAEDTKALRQQVRDEAMKRLRADPYDTHPPVAARIAAVQGLPEHASSARDERPAIDLLRGIDDLEAKLLAFASADRSAVGKLKPIEWSETGQEVLLAGWKDRLVKLRMHPAKPLHGITVAQVPTVLDRRAAIGKLAGGAEIPKEAEEFFGHFILEIAVGVALAGVGFQVVNLPGEPARLVRGGDEIVPSRLLKDLVQGKLDAAGWSATFAGIGIADVPLEP